MREIRYSDKKKEIIPNLRIVDWWWRGAGLFTAMTLLCCAVVAHLPRPNASLFLPLVQGLT